LGQFLLYYAFFEEVRETWRGQHYPFGFLTARHLNVLFCLTKQTNKQANCLSIRAPSDAVVFDCQCKQSQITGFVPNADCDLKVLVR